MNLDTLITGDCVEVMRGFQDDCIDLTVTSPPYDDLRHYDGYEFNAEAVITELLRVTKPGGVWVVNDKIVKGNRTLTRCSH